MGTSGMTNDAIPARIILAPVDFSEPSRRALAYAARFATHAGAAALHVVYAEDPWLAEGARRASIDLPQKTSEELGAFVDSTIRDAFPVPEHHRHVVRGPAVDAIVDAADRLNADLIVIATHGMSGVERVMFGSTTEGVLRKSRIPVLVVPSAAR